MTLPIPNLPQREHARVTAPALLAVATCFALTRVAQAAGPPPDILGLHLGMSPQEAFDVLKKIDPGHVAAVNQTTIPELYGDRPVVFAMTTTTTGGNDQILVSLTMPPAPQQVWQVRRTLKGFSATVDNLNASLKQKYGDHPFKSGLGGDVTTEWFFDQQLRPVLPTDLAGTMELKNCMVQQLNPMSVTPTAVTGSATNAPSVRHTTPLTMPPTFDPAVPSRCQNLIWVHVIATGGTYATLDVTISDFTMQHVAAKAYVEAIDAVVNQQQHAADRAVQQQGAPKL